MTIVDALRGFSLAGIVVVHMVENYAGGPKQHYTTTFRSLTTLEVVHRIFQNIARGAAFLPAENTPDSVTPNKDLIPSTRITFWKACYFLTLALLPVLIVLNFYGLYSNQFYFLKIDNYIFPAVSVLHFIFLYVMQFKIREGEYPDPVMRNVEYGMYAALVIYLFKCVDTLYILLSYEQYKAYLIPDTFLPMGVFIFLLQGLLVLLTLLSFAQRKQLVGAYDFEEIDKNMNSWQ